MYDVATPEGTSKQRSLTSLDHPNIIEYLAMGHVVSGGFVGCPGDLCLVMEYCGGGTLKKYVGDPKNHQIPTETITSYNKQLLEALSYMHGKKLSHRDLKSENILLTLNETILKICDLDTFGRLVGSQTARSDLPKKQGTRFFMLPEMVLCPDEPTREENGGTVGKSTDIWSLGCVVVEICTRGKMTYCDPNGKQMNIDIIYALSEDAYVELVRSGGRPFVNAPEVPVI